MLDRLLNQVNVLEKGLDAVWLNNEVIAGNIANADTPNYKAQSVNFESVFQDALSTGSVSASSQNSPSVFKSFLNNNADSSASASSVSSLDTLISRDQNVSLRMDGNSVDVDQQMTELAKNSVLYEALTYSVSKELGRIKMIINEGK